MPRQREEIVNANLALLLDQHTGITAAAEIRSSTEAIDLTVTHDLVTRPIPILIEAKIGTTPAKRRAAVKQARSRLTDKPQAIALALCYPADLARASRSATASLEALKRAKLTFAPVDPYNNAITWRTGQVSDLADTLHHADLPQKRVTNAIEGTVRKAAALFEMNQCGSKLAKQLALPKTEKKLKKDLRAASLIASLIISNAALLHHRLRLVPSLQNISSLQDAVHDPWQAHASVCQAWRQILDIDFLPVFEPALAALEALDDFEAKEPLLLIADNAIMFADELADMRV